jgi:hypothetical protein
MPEGKVIMPEMFGDKVKSKELKREEGKTEPWGAVTFVETFEDLPPNVAERIPELENSPNGFIIKEYKKNDRGIFNENDVDLFDDKTRNRLLDKGETNYSVVDKAMILQKRQDELTRYFSDRMPYAVVKSYYFVARPSEVLLALDETSKKDTPSLYEVQPKVDFKETLGELTESTLELLSEEQLEILSHSLDRLREILEDLLSEENDQTFTQYKPDLHAWNIAIDTSGEIKLFDTNLLRPSSESDYGAIGKSGNTHEEEGLSKTIEFINKAEKKIDEYLDKKENEMSVAA